MKAHRTMGVFFTMLFLVLGAFLPFLPVEAATQCQCVCATAAGTLPGKVTTVEQASSECPSSCNGYAGGTYQTCAIDAAEVTEGSTLCWDQDECEERVVNIDGVDTPSIWGTNQQRDCPAGKHYCYNPPQPVDLNIAISTLSNPKRASDIGEYVVAIYDLLIPASAVIAIVFIMIGGLQYVVARGDGGAIGKAKERISKAVVGLVLVLGAYTIANFIDPRLTSFEALKVPLHKSGIYIEGEGCEDVINQIRKVYCETKNLTEEQCLPEINSIIERLPATGGLTSGMCGTKCRIREIPDGIFLVGVAEGDERFFSSCDHVSAGASCFTDPSGDIAECLQCWDVNPVDQKFNIPASSTVCGKMDPVDSLQKSDGSYDVYGRCFSTVDANVVSGAVTDAQGLFVGGTCAALAVFCENVDACSDYGDAGVIAGPAPQAGTLYGTFVNGFQAIFGGGTDMASLSQIESGSVTYESVCKLDPCRVGGCGWINDTCVSPETEQGSSAGRNF